MYAVMRNIVGYGTCAASFVLGHVFCYFFAHAEIAGDVLFYLGQCLIYSASFLGFRLYFSRSDRRRTASYCGPFCPSRGGD